jgi:hypothetical protein
VKKIGNGYSPWRFTIAVDDKGAGYGSLAPDTFILFAGDIVAVVVDRADVSHSNFVSI